MHSRKKATKRVEINKKKCCWLLDGVSLSRNAKVLVSWHDKTMDELLKRAVPDIGIEYLMEMDFDAFFRQKSWADDGCYDFIFDNGLLAETNMDGMLLRSLGMHLKSGGGVRTVLPGSFEKFLVGSRSYENNFNRAIFISGFEAEKDSFYIAELAGFQRKVTWLQSFYTPELRRELAFLLQRIDFDVQAEANIRALQVFLQHHGISKEYLRFLVDTAVIHKEKLYCFCETGGIV